MSSDQGKPGQLITRQGASMREVKRVGEKRVLALIDQTFDLLDEEQRTGARDPVKALADAFHRDPLAWLERVRKLMSDQSTTGGNKPLLSMQAMFVSAARETAGQIGVIQGLDHQILEQDQIDW